MGCGVQKLSSLDLDIRLLHHLGPAAAKGMIYLLPGLLEALGARTRQLNNERILLQMALEPTNEDVHPYRKNDEPKPKGGPYKHSER